MFQSVTFVLPEYYNSVKSLCEGREDTSFL